MQLLLAQSHCIDSNRTTQRGVNALSASECYDWPGVDVLRHHVLNSYVLIPVILFCIYTEHITCNLLVMLQLLIPVNCRNKFTGI